VYGQPAAVGLALEDDGFAFIQRDLLTISCTFDGDDIVRKDRDVRSEQIDPPVAAGAADDAVAVATPLFELGVPFG
jgi:hypothetical protein